MSETKVRFKLHWKAWHQLILARQVLNGMPMSLDGKVSCSSSKAQPDDFNDDEYWATVGAAALHLSLSDISQQ